MNAFYDSDSNLILAKQIHTVHAHKMSVQQLSTFIS
uniref:Uncharacterized protein n=1 Tax=Anguilla anguilla TaxID=7936 RepID=A0A0E9QLY4_ANGAN